jgi:hypothetical protein
MFTSHEVRKEKTVSYKRDGPGFRERFQPVVRIPVVGGIQTTRENLAVLVTDNKNSTSLRAARFVIHAIGGEPKLNGIMNLQWV